MSNLKTASTPRLTTGIAGFDALSGGDLARGKVTLLIGNPGSGNTVFGMQALINAAQRADRGVYVCFEETSEEAKANLRTFSWVIPRRFERLVKFIDADLGPHVVCVGGFELSGLLAAIEAQAEEIRASWLVFDGIDALLAALADPVARRREVYRCAAGSSACSSDAS
jgi:circadian clock protein KaiC